MTNHDFDAIPMREALRRHMIGYHNWPVVTRSTPSFEELDAVHRDLHDPEVDRERALAQMRRLLESPPEDVAPRKWWHR